MNNIGDFIKNRPTIKTAKSERAEIIKNIYALYTSESERNQRKIENWKRFVLYLRANHLKKTPEEIEKFKKHKTFIKEMPIRNFCFFISHIKTPDLYYCLSVMKDEYARGNSCGRWLIGRVMEKKSYPQFSS